MFALLYGQSLLCFIGICAANAVSINVAEVQDGERRAKRGGGLQSAPAFCVVVVAVVVASRQVFTCGRCTRRCRRCSLDLANV